MILCSRKLRSAGLSLTPVDTRQNCTQALILWKSGISAPKFAGWEYPASQSLSPEEDSVLCKVHDTAVTKVEWHMLTCKINVHQSFTFSQGRVLCAKRFGVFAFCRCRPSHVFYKSKTGQSSVPCSCTRKVWGITARKQVVFGLPVALPAEQDTGMGRGDSAWFPLCIDTAVTSAAEIAVALLMPSPRPP